MRRTELLGLVLMLPLLASALVVPSVAKAASGTQRYIGFRKQATAPGFAGSELKGTVVMTRDGRADIRLAASGTGQGKNEALYGTSKPYRWGRLVSPQFEAAYPFNRAIPSWNAFTPAGTWIQVELRAYRPSTSGWTRYYNMGIWASGSETIKRHSVVGQRDADGAVATDTLVLDGGAAYTRYQYRLTLFTTDPVQSPRVRLMSVLTSDSSREPAGLKTDSDREAWGRDLQVPQRSQMLYPPDGKVWCSPTSTSMVLAYWSHDVPVRQAAAATYDSVYDGTGNWPFNTAWASTLGPDAYVTRFSSVTQIEEWISAGVPVVIPYSFDAGEMDGAPQRSTNGHVLVVRGFTAAGDVIVNDPAASSNSGVRRVYKRGQVEKAWLEGSGGTVYLIYPKGHVIPTAKRYGSW